MDDIPDDINEIASRIADRQLRQPWKRETLLRVIALAITAERARCALIARTCDRSFSDANSIFDDLAKAILKDVAALEDTER